MRGRLPPTVSPTSSDASRSPGKWLLWNVDWWDQPIGTAQFHLASFAPTNKIASLLNTIGETIFDPFRMKRVRKVPRWVTFARLYWREASSRLEILLRLFQLLAAPKIKRCRIYNHLTIDKAHLCPTKWRNIVEAVAPKLKQLSTSTHRTVMWHCVCWRGWSAVHTMNSTWTTYQCQVIPRSIFPSAGPRTNRKPTFRKYWDIALKLAVEELFGSWPLFM